MTIQPLTLSTATTLRTKPAPTYVEVALKIGAALLITFAATLVLVPLGAGAELVRYAPISGPYLKR
jgi:hypothetical protein